MTKSKSKSKKSEKNKDSSSATNVNEVKVQFIELIGQLAQLFIDFKAAILDCYEMVPPAIRIIRITTHK